MVHLARQYEDADTTRSRDTRIEQNGIIHARLCCEKCSVWLSSDQMRQQHLLDRTSRAGLGELTDKPAERGGQVVVECRLTRC